MAFPRATIIIPARDIADFLPSALLSLQQQSVENFRVIIVNDGSVDRTGDIADAAAASDDRIRVVHNPVPLGLGAARNRGIALVDTEYFALLDGDDEYAPDAIARWLTVLDESHSPFAAAAYMRLREQPDGTWAAGNVQPWVAAATAPSAQNISLRDRPAAANNIVAWSKMYETQFWRENDLVFPDGSYEDQVVAQQLYTRAFTFSTIAEPLVRWRVRPGSITASKGELTVLRDYLAALRAGIETLLTAGEADAVRERIRAIRSIDVPPLAKLAALHPSEDYRAELSAFESWLATLPGADTAPADPSLTAALSW